jgi:hypothetical protein
MVDIHVLLGQLTLQQKRDVARALGFSKSCIGVTLGEDTPEPPDSETREPGP